MLIRRNALSAFALSVVVSFAMSEAAFGQNRADMDKLERDFRAAYDKKDWPKATELGLKIHEAAPAGGGNAYNVACIYSLAGEKAKALEWLKKSVDMGFADTSLMGTDADLENIRKEPQFKEIVDAAKKGGEKGFEDFKKKADASKPLIIPPPKSDGAKPAPVIVVMHGFGGTAEEIAEAWKTVALERGAVLVAPRAIRPAGGEGFEWGRVEEAEYILTRALEQVAKEQKIDEKKVVLTGFSQGGMLAYVLGLKHAGKFCGIIPVAGLYNSQTVKIPTAGALPKFCILIGDKDRALEENKQAAKDLEAAKSGVKLNVYPDLGHAFPKDREAELRKALDFVLGA